jgi:hypothetical protein
MRTKSLNAIRFVSENTGMAVGDSGTILLSQNPSGANGMSGRWWRPMPPVLFTLRPATNYRSVAFADPHTVYAAGSDSSGTHIWRSQIRDALPRIRWRGGHKEEPIGALKVYPNPATNTLHIEGSRGPFTIVDEFGERYSLTFKNGMLDVSSLPAGVYYITDDRNRARFVKE